MRQVKIEQSTIQLEDGNKGTVAVFLYGGKGNPMMELDKAVNEYVGNDAFNQFIDINMDNPWVRVVIVHADKLKHHATI